MWLDRLKMKFRGGAFDGRVITGCMSLINELLDSDDETARNTFQKSMSFKSFDMILELGSEAVEDFRKGMIEDVLKIVQDDDPVRSMRKELITRTNTSIRSQLFFSEEFQDRRQELYDMYKTSFEFARQNMEPAKPVDSFEDWVSSVSVLRTEAELVILRVLQMCHFEDVGKDDWFIRYWRSCTLLYRVIYRKQLGFKKIDGRALDYVFSLAKEAVDQLQQEIIGEVIGW